jgi:hypothetical protein
MLITVQPFLFHLVVKASAPRRLMRRAKAMEGFMEDPFLVGMIGL